MRNFVDRLDEQFTSLLLKLVNKHTSFKMNELKKIKSDNLNLSLFQYIHVIHQLNTPSLSKIADYLKVSKPAVTAVIDKLVKQNYVLKVQSLEDRRVFYIQLTEKGEKIALAFRKSHQYFVKDIRNKLDDGEFERLIMLLTKTI